MTNPAGSSNALRGDVLRVLGVLKVATADQVQRLAAPHLMYRHLGKRTESERKEARTRAHRAAAQDLKRHGLVVEAGFSRAGEKLWAPTAAGLEAAALELGRPPREMGGAARGAGRTGAAHALCVGETVWALSRPAPDLERLKDAPHAAQEAARRAPAGFGTVESWATEVPLPATGTWAGAGRGGAQADAVLAAPEAGVPLLFVEVDTCHMDATRIATKVGKYMQFLKRQVTAGTGKWKQPMWRTRWEYPDGHLHRESLPPLLLVFHRLGPRSPKSSWELVADRSRRYWRGVWVEDGYHEYGDKIPLLFTTIDDLLEHGPHGAVFHRAGRDQPQTLHDAIGNPRQDAALARQRAQREDEARQQAAAREARRPACTECGAKFTDARWTQTEGRAEGWDAHRDLCETCAPAAAAREHAAREAALEVARLEECRRCQEPRRDDRWPGLPAELRMDRRHVPPPDGEHCAACRVALNPTYTERGRLGRLLRGS